MAQEERGRVINPTGGLIYHLRAARHANGAWAPFRRDLGRWLEGWRPRERKLLLIGPSAGYSLLPSFLRRFESFVAVDPDPLARWMFTRRLGSPAGWERGDYLRDGAGEPSSRRFAELLAAHPGHAVLFCNLLGQLKLLPGVKEPALRGWFASLPEMLKGRSFASYHDRLSGELAPRLSPESGALTNDQLSARFYNHVSRSDGRALELIDHLTDGIFPGLPRAYFHWQLHPRAHHLIEGVHSA